LFLKSCLQDHTLRAWVRMNGWLMLSS
jgi:hypothetical protein